MKTIVLKIFIFSSLLLSGILDASSQSWDNIKSQTQTIQQSPNNAINWSNRAREYVKLGQYELALSDYNKAIELNPADRFILDDRGSLYYTLGKFDLAISDFTRALQIAPNPVFGEPWNTRGNIYFNEGKYDLAIQDYSAQIYYKPKKTEAWMYRGNAYCRLGKYDSAIVDYTHVIQQKPQEITAWENRGTAYCMQGKYDSALPDFYKALQINIKDGYSLQYIGYIYNLQGKYDSAIASYSAVLKIYPNDLFTILNIILVHCHQNQYKLASQYLIQNNTRLDSILRRPYNAYKTKYISACTDFLSTDDFTHSMPLLLEAIKLYKENIDSLKWTNTDITYSNILVKTGWVYEQMNNLQKANEYYIKAQTINQFVENVENKISNLHLKIQSAMVNDTMPPEVQIITPKVTRSQTVEADDIKEGQLYIGGTAKDMSGIAWVKVNDSITDINSSGYFFTNVSSSTKKVVIQASDLKGNIATETYMVEQPSVPASFSNNAYSIPPITIVDNPVFHAVLIACSDYSGVGWRPLPSTIPEAKKMKEVLVSKYGFENANILELYNKDYIGILSGLSSKLESMKENDNLVIYYGGHGTYKQKGTELIGYWVPVNSTNIDVDYISNKKLDELIAGSKVKHILMLSDACYSGAMRSNDEVKTPTKWEYKLRSRQILTSGGLEKVPGESVFVKMVLQALENNDDTYLSVSELYNIIYAGVKKQTDNEPKLNDFGRDGNEGGQFYFMKKN